MKYKIIITCLLFVILNTQCKKDSNSTDVLGLPPATQVGAKTFGCLVNGVAVTPNSSCINCPPLSGGYDPSPNGQFSITCYYDNGTKAIIIGLDSIFTYRNYDINNIANRNARVSHFNRAVIDSCQFVGSLDPFKSITGKVNLTRIDVTNGIFSGTFSFRINTNNCGNYEVTNGRFDYKF